jgi:hypothetical protein
LGEGFKFRKRRLAQLGGAGVVFVVIGAMLTCHGEQTPFRRTWGGLAGNCQSANALHARRKYYGRQKKYEKVRHIHVVSFSSAENVMKKT